MALRGIQGRKEGQCGRSRAAREAGGALRVKERHAARGTLVLKGRALPERGRLDLTCF